MDKNSFRLGPDGELESVPTEKRKSKEGLYPPPKPPLIEILLRIVVGILLLSLGIAVGVVGGGYLMPAPPPPPTVVAVIPSVTPLALLSTAFPPSTTASATIAPSSSPTQLPPTRTPTYAAFPSPEYTASSSPIPAFPPGSDVTLDGSIPQLIINVQSGAMYRYAEPTGLVLLPMRGHEVAASRDGKLLAYVGLDMDTRIFVYREGKEVPLNAFAIFHMPAWAPNGKSLAFISRGSDGHDKTGDWVSWVKMTASFNTDGPLYTGFSKLIDAPPLTDPATGNILVIWSSHVNVSTFTLVDPMCGCDIPPGGTDQVTIPYAVTGATYNADGSKILFSEESGDLYLMDTATRKVSLFLHDDTEKHGPTLSPDDKLLAYFDNANHVYMMTMADQHGQTLTLPETINRVTWAYSSTM